MLSPPSITEINKQDNKPLEIKINRKIWRVSGSTLYTPKPPMKHYFMMIRGVQIELRAHSMTEAFEKAKHWWWLTDVSN